MKTKRIMTTYLLTTLFCVVFNYIYSLFGHGVRSPYMTYAFAFCLMLGAGGFFVLGRLDLEQRVAFNLYNAGIATLTVGSLLRGVLDIAGADATYPEYYFIVGTGLVVGGGLLYFFQWIQISRDHELP